MNGRKTFIRTRNACSSCRLPRFGKEKAILLILTLLIVLSILIFSPKHPKDTLLAKIKFVDSGTGIKTRINTPEPNPLQIDINVRPSFKENVNEDLQKIRSRNVAEKEQKELDNESQQEKIEVLKNKTIRTNTVEDKRQEPYNGKDGETSQKKNKKFDNKKEKQSLQKEIKKKAEKKDELSSQDQTKKSDFKNDDRPLQKQTKQSDVKKDDPSSQDQTKMSDNKNNNTNLKGNIVKLHDEDHKDSSERSTKKPFNETYYGSKLQFELNKKMFLKYSSIFKNDIVNCSAIFEGNITAVSHGIATAEKIKNIYIGNEYYMNITKNCDKFKTDRGYITSFLSKEEEDFPIAYSVLAYKDIEMVERLFRQIYRPQNVYCIHIDGKSKVDFFKAIQAIVDCFPNVFMASRRIEVKIGTFSVLEPELICMKDLYSKRRWKYLINLSGQEMPLKTNLELVKILTAYQGANDVQGSMQRVLYSRWREDEIGPAPLDIQPLKGSVHMAASREFVNYILHNKTATKILEWVKKTKFPDETFFTTLNHNPLLRIPGTFRGWPEQDNTNRKPYLAMYENQKPYRKSNCAGKRQRGLCILSTGDLPFLKDRAEMFAQRFHIFRDRVVIGCLEEKLFNNTRDGFFRTRNFNTTLYQGLGFVIEQVGKPVTRKFKQVDNVV